MSSYFEEETVALEETNRLFSSSSSSVGFDIGMDLFGSDDCQHHVRLKEEEKEYESLSSPTTTSPTSPNLPVGSPSPASPSPSSPSVSTSSSSSPSPPKRKEPSKNKKEAGSKRQKDCSSPSRTFYTPLTLIHKIGKKNPRSGEVCLLRFSTRRAVYSLQTQGRPIPFLLFDQQQENKQEVKVASEIETDTSRAVTMGYLVKKIEVASEDGGKLVSNLRNAAKCLHTKDLSHPRFYFDLDIETRFHEKNSNVVDRELLSVDSAKVFVEHNCIYQEGRLKTETSASTSRLFLRCRWAPVKSTLLALPQTNTTWEHIETLLHVFDWRIVLEKFFCSSFIGSFSTSPAPSIWPLVGPPEFVSKATLGVDLEVKCSMMSNVSDFRTLDEWAENFETFLALRAFDFSSISASRDRALSCSSEVVTPSFPLCPVCSTTLPMTKAVPKSSPSPVPSTPSPGEFLSRMAHSKCAEFYQNLKSQWMFGTASASTSTSESTPFPL